MKRDSLKEFIALHEIVSTALSTLPIADIDAANPDLLRCTKFKPYFSPPATNDSVVQIKGLKIFTTRIIGTGGFADVYHGSWHAQEAVVKCFKHLTCTETLYRWLQILKTLDSPYCVRVFDVFCSAMPIKGTSIVLAMEMMDLGSMKHFLTTPEAKAMPFEGLMGKIQKIASGMDYLEEKGVVHTNLKDTNVLLQSDGSVKLVDIGIRSALSTVYESSPGAFAFDCWSAPELESHPTNFTIKSDVWAFGILSYVILTRGAEPYQGWEMSAIPQHLAIGGRPEKPPSLSVEMYNMLKRCWEYKAEDRPSFREILSWTYASEENYEHDAGSLTLSRLVRENSNSFVQHYHVTYDVASGGYYVRCDEKLGSLDELINFYRGEWMQSHHDVGGTRRWGSGLSWVFESLHSGTAFDERVVVKQSLCLSKLSYSAQKFGICVMSRASVALKHCLNSGNLSEVWLAKYCGVDVAVKRALATTSRQEIVKEADIMHQLYHPRLPVMIITEFMPNGALDGYLREKQPSYEELLGIIFQISDGMAYLEQHRVVHNDLRAANILVDGNESVKVADFGPAKILHYDGRDKCDGMFPVRRTPPEATEVGVFHSTKSDVWSFGVLMYKMFTYGGVPYDDIPDDNDVIVAVENGRRLCNPSELGYRCEEEMYTRMQACWDSNPEARPSFEQLYVFLNPLMHLPRRRIVITAS
ncbi:Tyrosine-protein kinase HCK [Taenia crassiceps]|uniref:Tyrosine-protein kinase HCK n=1 Tax=Taenia crassiceps TaxID=6207 RepID=A0ABR4Q5H1_9CEST